MTISVELGEGGTMNEQPVTVGRDPIDQLADKFLGQFRRGEKPSLSEYAVAHPDLAAEIQELFPTLVLLERLSPRQDEVVGQQVGTGPIREMPQTLGEYRIIREVGRGGMGIVYEAEQMPLGRHVALKVLPSSAVLNPSVLTRFQNEVRAAARLHHTNIVPVFGVGEDQGIHYYAMQFISGQGLDVVLEELRRLRCKVPAVSPSSSGNGKLHGTPANMAGQPGAPASAVRGSSTSHGTSQAEYFHSVARMGLHVAEALAHAHSQGVLHRDIKPANLLVDAQGCVWVTDFGLAKQAGCEVTNTGDVVGTLRYLAPERFQGTSDTRSDIYGLGVTLYELLTTQPAFPATDRARLVHDIVHNEPPQPRRFERHLPRDLETIVLKAMAKAPAERYASAAELAADLRRFLDDKPIGARRLSLGERLWRWSVRRPALAGLAAALLLTLTVGVGSVFWQWVRAETNLKEAVRQQDIAGRQREIAEQEATRAEANYHTARQAVDELLTMVSQDELKNQPGLQPLRVRLLTRALEYYQGMLEQRGSDPKARAELISNYLRVAEIKRLTGVRREAVETYQKAIELLEVTLAEDYHSSAALQLVGACNYLALILIDDRRFDEAFRLLLRAREVVERVNMGEPSAAADRLTALTLNDIAWCTSQRPSDDRRGPREQAIELHQQALAIYRRLVREQPDDFLFQLALSATLSNMARRTMELGQNEEAQPLLEECLAIRLDLLHRHPASHDARYQCAAVYDALGDVVARAGGFAPDARQRALDYYQKSLEILEPLTRENPAVIDYRQTMAEVFRGIATVHRNASDWTSAVDVQARAVPIFESLLLQNPANWNHHYGLALACGGLATAERRLERYEDSIAHRIRARQAWSEVLRLDPTQLPRFRKTIVDNLASLMQELGAAERMDDVYEVALAQRELIDGSASSLYASSSVLQKATRAATRGVTEDNESLAATARCQQLAVALFREAALAAPEKAVELARGQSHMRSFALLAPLDADLARTPDDPAILARRSIVLRKLGDEPGAIADRERAVQLFDASLRKTPKNRFALYQRAKLHLDAGRFEQAASDCDRVLAILPDHVTTLECRARASAALGRWQQARDDLTRVLELRPDLTGHWPHRCRAAYELGHGEEARSDAARLVELAGDNVFRVEGLMWTFLVERQVARFPEASIELGKRESALATQPTHRRPLGGVYVQLGRYREAIEALAPEKIDIAGESSAFAAFWLAISHHHLGEHEKAEQAFHQGVRNWKGAGALTPSREDFLRETWQEARALLFGSEKSAARS